MLESGCEWLGVESDSLNQAIELRLAELHCFCVLIDDTQQIQFFFCKAIVAFFFIYRRFLRRFRKFHVSLVTTKEEVWPLEGRVGLKPLEHSHPHI